MSLSKECQTYHLTSKGWTEGSFCGDVVGGKTETTPPEDTVLTVNCYDEITSVYSKSSFRDQIIWMSEDHELVNDLKAKYGSRPDWYGYNM